MESDTHIATIKRLAARLACIPPGDAEQQALLGFAVGAAYSLERAFQLGYSDEMSATPGAPYAAELRSVADSISKSIPPANGKWLAGYYFNSGLLRLAALGERVGRYATGAKWDVAPAVRRDVNHMKHDIDVLLSTGREAKTADALDAITMLTGALELAFRRSRP